MLRAFTIFTLFLLFNFEAYAGGDVYSRITDGNSFSSCSGTAIETYQNSGNIHGFSDNYVLACMTDDTHASWVLQSGLECSDEVASPAWNDPQSRCSNTAVSLLPFNKTPDFWKENKPPYKIKFAFIRYGVGKECQLIRQKRPKGSYLNSAIWVCDSLDFTDGSLSSSGQTLEIDKFRTMEVSTFSKNNLVTSECIINRTVCQGDILYPFLASGNPETCRVGYSGEMASAVLNCSGFDAIFDWPPAKPSEPTWEDVLASVKQNCIKQWSNDYSMQAYCVQLQKNGFTKMQNVR